MVFNCTERGGFPCFACIETLYLIVSLIILNESTSHEQRFDEMQRSFADVHCERPATAAATTINTHS